MVSQYNDFCERTLSYLYEKTPPSFFCVLAISTMAARSAETPKLNLLFITADDMNWDSPGWMGSDMGATPVLDGFAATCHRFINDHVTVPICQPSREAFLTGRVPTPQLQGAWIQSHHSRHSDHGHRAPGRRLLHRRD